MAVDSQRLEALRDKHGVPGASFAVLHDGDVDATAAGVLHLGTGAAATTESLFQIGSITKVWTATMVMQLVAEGALELGHPVRRHLPDFRVADEAVSEAVTIRHLLNHTSGIDGDHFADTGRGDDVLEKYVDSCAHLRQVHPLGATMSYCNTGYAVLGRVIEVLTGEVWDTAVRSRLVTPLGLTHTATLPEDVLRFGAAMGHIQPPGADLQPAPVWSLPRSMGPAGLVCTTATDLLAFARLHFADRAGHLDAMADVEVTVPSGGPGLLPERWGLGWAVYDWGDRTVIGHDGGTIGQSAFLRVVPDAGVAVALLTNGGNAMALFEDVAAELLADAAGVTMPPAPVPPAEPLPFDPAPHLGVYEREGVRIEVVARGDGMVGIQSVTGPAAALTPEPVELPFIAFDRDRFLTPHPAAPGTWLLARFVTLPDGSGLLHMAGRATPRVDD